MFTITSSLPPTISQNYTKLCDLENEVQGHYPLMTLETIVWAIRDSL